MAIFQPKPIGDFLCIIGDCYPEIGYISIAELVKNGAEIDLHFDPKTLGEIKASF